jgi:hypothetical protein
VNVSNRFLAQFQVFQAQTGGARAEVQARRCLPSTRKARSENMIQPITFEKSNLPKDVGIAGSKNRG